jgi:hypothetical protein
MREVAVDLNEQVALETMRPQDEAASSDEEEEKPYWCLKCRRIKATEESKRQKAELAKKCPKPKSQATVIQERVSTRQLARSAQRRESADIEMESLDSQRSDLNPEESQRTLSKGNDGTSEPVRSSRVEKRELESSVKTRRRVLEKKFSAELSSRKVDAPIKETSRD